MYAMTEAGGQFQKAMECGEKSSFPPDEDPQDIRMEQALSLKLASEHEAALEIFVRLIDDATDPARQGWALNHAADIHRMNGNTTPALEAYARCEEIARQRDDEALLLEVAADLHELHDRWAERLVGTDPDEAEKHREASKHYLDEQARLAETSDDTAAQSRAYRNIAKRHRRAEEYDEALENYEGGIALSDPRVATHKVQIPYAKTLRYVDRHQEALEVVERVLDWSLQTGARRSEGIGRQYHGLLLMETGEPGDAQKALEELTSALTIHREVGFDRGEHETATLLGEWHLYEGGDWSTALDYFHQAIDDDPPGPAETVRVIVAQLHAIGEDHRAERLEAAGPPPDDLHVPADEAA
jgi:tetratricopeptide (TPR) repeat protein